MFLSGVKSYTINALLIFNDKCYQMIYCILSRDRVKSVLSIILYEKRFKVFFLLF